jgi:hypothetical protein
MLLNKKIILGCIASLVLAGMAAISGNVYSAGIELPNAENGIEREDLDVNLNVVLFGTRQHRSNNTQSELVVQVPFPITKKAKETGLGPIGAVVYFDNKELVHIKKTNALGLITQNSDINDSATARGLGRLYYFLSAFDTTHTVVPYVTFYRELLIDYTDPANNNSVESKFHAWFPPGIEYAYRKDEKIVLHLDAELYSYSKPANHALKMGGSYAIADKWLLSASVERLNWDMEDGVNKNVFIKGNSNNVYLKLINSNPLRNNFAVMLGYASDKNNTGTGLLPAHLHNENGFFFGIEYSFGTLAW